MMMTGLVTCDDDDDDDEWLCQRWSVAWETRWWKAIGDLLKYIIVFILKNHNQIHWLNYVSIFPLKCHTCQLVKWHHRFKSNSLLGTVCTLYSLQCTLSSIYWGMKIEGHPDNATSCQDFLFLILHPFQGAWERGKAGRWKNSLENIGRFTINGKIYITPI